MASYVVLPTEVVEIWNNLERVADSDNLAPQRSKDGTYVVSALVRRANTPPHYSNGSPTLALLETIYHSRDLEVRLEALGTAFQWYSASRAFTAHWVRSVVPLFQSPTDPLVPYLTSDLNRLATSATERTQWAPETATAFAILLEVCKGYEYYLLLFERDPELRVQLSGLLTCCLDAADVSRYLPLLLNEYASRREEDEKRDLLVSIGKVRQYVPEWREMLVSALQQGGNLGFAAASEMIALDGDTTPRAIWDTIVSAKPGNLRSYWSPLTRGLRALSRPCRLALLSRLLAVHTETPNSLLFGRLVLESVYGRLGVSRLRAHRADLIEFAWYGPGSKADIQFCEDDIDWIHLLISTASLWNNTVGRHQGEPVRTNLYELFGLPCDRQALAAFCKSLIGRVGDRSPRSPADC